MSSNQNNKRGLNNNSGPRNNSRNTTMNLGSNNNTNNTTAKLNNAKPTFLNTAKKQMTSLSPITIFIIVIIVLVLGYISVTYIYAKIVNNRDIKVSKNVLVDTITDGMIQLDIGSSQLPNSSYSNEYALSTWVYVDDFNYKHGERKFILRRGDIKSVINPEIYIHPSQNTLQVNVSLITSKQNVSTPTTINIDNTEATTSTEAGVSNFKDIDTFQNMESNNMESNNMESINSNNNFNLNLEEVPDELREQQHYDNGYFSDVVNTNIVNYPNQPAHHKRIEHNPELNLVMEQFTDPEDCKCDNTSDSGISEEERKSFEDGCGKCFVENFPLQKWVHLVVSQYNNVIDIYVDGKLSSSCSMPSSPEVTTDDLILSPDEGFSGQMGSTVYFNTALSAIDVHKIYSKGPEGDRQGGVVSKLQSIPTWIYGIVILLIIGIVAYSFFI